MEIPAPQFRIEPGGYAVEDVDALLNQFFSVLEANPQALTGPGLRGVRFRTISSRPGYSPAQVDAWITNVAHELDRQANGEVDYSAPSPPPNTPTSSPAPYDELEPGFDLPSELHAPMASTSTGPIDPATDPGRNAVKELPATPPWASLTVLIVLLTMVVYFGYTYFR